MHAPTRSFLIAAILSLLVMPFPAAAQESGWYQVEVLVFENDDSTEAQSETWPAEPGTPGIEGAHELTAPLDGAAADTPYVLLPAEALQLRRANELVARSGQRQPILHVGWRQPTVEKDKAQVIHIRGGKEFVKPAPAIAQDFYIPEPRPGAVDEPGPTSEQAAEVSQSETVSQIDGTITISRARYLHVWADLVYTRQAPTSIDAPVAAEEALVRYRLKEHRRMRSQELHYLDHPMFGILVLITPYELPKREEPPVQPIQEAPPESPTPPTS